MTIKAPKILSDLSNHIFSGFDHVNPKFFYPNSGAQLLAAKKANCVRFRGSGGKGWRAVSIDPPVQQLLMRI